MRKFKDPVLVAYNNLFAPVDSDTLAAREIVAEYYRRKHYGALAHRVKTGCDDMTTEMLIATAAFKASNAAAAERIKALEEALRDCLGWHDYADDLHKPAEVRAAYMRARKMLKEADQ
jgi:hypothetical protein